MLTVDDNFCRLMQRSEQELIGRSYTTITAPGDLEKSAKMLNGLVDKAAPTRLQKQYVRPDGSLVKVDLRVSRFDGDDRLVSSLSWVEDRPHQATPRQLWRAARHIKALYAMRASELGADLFSDPVALILLEVYVAEAEGRVATIADIAAAAELPRASTTRWIRALEQRDLIHALGTGAAMMQLTEQGSAKVERLLTSALRPGDA